MVTHDRFAGDEDRRGEGRVGQQAIQPILQDAQDSAIGFNRTLTEPYQAKQSLKAWDQGSLFQSAKSTGSRESVQT